MQDFNLDMRKGDIDTVIKNNAFMAELQSRIVPLIVQYEDFWTRYFYQCVPCSHEVPAACARCQS